MLLYAILTMLTRLSANKKAWLSTVTVDIARPLIQLHVILVVGKDCSREGRLEQGLLWVVIRLHGRIKSMDPMKDVEPYQHTPVCPLTEELFHRRHAIDMTAATVYIHEFRRCLTISSVPRHEAFSHWPHFVHWFLTGQDWYEDLTQLICHIGAPFCSAFSVSRKFW